MTLSFNLHLPFFFVNAETKFDHVSILMPNIFQSLAVAAIDFPLLDYFAANCWFVSYSKIFFLF